MIKSVFPPILLVFPFYLPFFFSSPFSTFYNAMFSIVCFFLLVQTFTYSILRKEGYLKTTVSLCQFECPNSYPRFGRDSAKGKGKLLSSLLHSIRKKTSKQKIQNSTVIHFLQACIKYGSQRICKTPWVRHCYSSYEYTQSGWKCTTCGMRYTYAAIVVVKRKKA